MLQNKCKLDIVYSAVNTIIWKVKQNLGLELVKLEKSLNDQLQKKTKCFSRCGGASRDVSGGAGVMDVTPSNVVVKVGFRNLLLRIYRHLYGP